MLNFCPLCVAEVYALRCDAVFLYLQNLYLSTSKRCIKMGIPSLNSAILYNVSLYFPFTDPSLALRMTPKSCKYNNYLGPRPQKQPFSWTEYSFFRSHPRKQPFLWTTKSRQQNWNLCASREEWKRVYILEAQP